MFFFNCFLSKCFKDMEEYENDYVSIPNTIVHWENLPNEIMANVVGYMDLETSLIYKSFGYREAELVRKFAKNDVFLFVEHIKLGHMIIRLLDITSVRKAALTWHVIQGYVKNLVEVRLINSDGQLIHKKKVKKADYAQLSFQLIGSIFSNPNYSVKKLEFRLNEFDQQINLPQKISGVDELCITDCVHHDVIESISDSFADNDGPQKVYINHVKYGFEKKDYVDSLLFPLFYEAGERYLNLRWLLNFTDFPFRGNPELRDAAGNLTALGFNKFLKILLSRDIPKREADFTHCFLFPTNYRSQIQTVGFGLRWSNGPDNTVFRMQDRFHTILVTYGKGYTMGEIQKFPYVLRL